MGSSLLRIRYPFSYGFAAVFTIAADACTPVTYVTSAAAAATRYFKVHLLMGCFSHGARLRFTTEGAGQRPQYSGPGFHKVPTFTPAPTRNKPAGGTRKSSLAKAGRFASLPCCNNRQSHTVAPSVVVGSPPGLVVLGETIKANLRFSHTCDREYRYCMVLAFCRRSPIRRPFLPASPVLIACSAFRALPEFRPLTDSLTPPIGFLLQFSLHPKVVCPQQLDQFFWAERVRYLAVGSVLERSLFVFVEREPAPAEPPGPLVCQAAAAILSALTPQVGQSVTMPCHATLHYTTVG